MAGPSVLGHLFARGELRCVLGNLSWLAGALLGCAALAAAGSAAAQGTSAPVHRICAPALHRGPCGRSAVQRLVTVRVRRPGLHVALLARLRGEPAFVSRVKGDPSTHRRRRPIEMYFHANATFAHFDRSRSTSTSPCAVLNSGNDPFIAAPPSARRTTPRSATSASASVRDLRQRAGSLSSRASRAFCGCPRAIAPASPSDGEARGMPRLLLGGSAIASCGPSRPARRFGPRRCSTMSSSAARWSSAPASGPPRRRAAH